LINGGTRTNCSGFSDCLVLWLWVRFEENWCLKNLM
jgi:hypothetical protein